MEGCMRLAFLYTPAKPRGVTSILIYPRNSFILIPAQIAAIQWTLIVPPDRSDDEFRVLGIRSFADIRHTIARYLIKLYLMVC